MFLADLKQQQPPLSHAGARLFFSPQLQAAFEHASERKRAHAKGKKVSGGMYADEEDARWVAVELYNKHTPADIIPQPPTSTGCAQIQA